MNDNNNSDIIALNRCEVYDINTVELLYRKQFKALGINYDIFLNKKVVIKPNLVIKYGPDKAATTHPVMIEAACRILKEAGAKEIIIAESPGGSYTNAYLNMIYKSTGISALEGVELNCDTSFREQNAKDGVMTKYFNVISPICDADIIINICKLKTHTFALMSSSVKNFFGVIPGIQKVEFHARFKQQEDFFNMIIDLCDMIITSKPAIHIVDAVIGMEGNGPSGGTPRKFGCILSGTNPFAIDAVCSEILGLEGKVPTVELSRKRNKFGKYDVIGDNVNDFKVKGLKMPDTEVGKKFSIIPNFLKSHPEISPERCIRCGGCIRSCPEKAIFRDDKNGKLKIKLNNCIRCYCCHELCSHKAVDIKKSFIYNIVK